MSAINKNLNLEDIETLEETLEQRAYEAVMAGVRSALQALGSSPGEMTQASPPQEAQKVKARAVGRKGRSRKAKQALTPNQQEVLDVITSYYEEHGQSPTYAEIAETLDKSGVGATILTIAEKGWIHLDPDRYSRKIIPL